MKPNVVNNAFVFMIDNVKLCESNHEAHESAKKRFEN